MKRKQLYSALTAATLALTLAACEGDDGNDGAQGPAGTPGADGAAGNDGQSSLISQRELQPGDANCPAGGIRIDSGLDANSDGVLSADEIDASNFVCNGGDGMDGNVDDELIGSGIAATGFFNRIATFPVCLQNHPSCDSDEETVAEIVDATSDGMTLIYTDSPGDRIGFVDITNPTMPTADGVLDLDGEPTAVAVAGNYALVGVNTAADFVNVSGQLDVVDTRTRTIVRSIDLGGQPDSVATSPDARYAAVAIENERDEDLGDGAPPQLPAGYLVIVDMVGAPADWSTRRVEFTGLEGMRFADDPEPEYVDISPNNQIAVSLQENNHIVVVDAASGDILSHFSAGTVDLTLIDTEEEDPAIIDQTSQLSDVPREPDGLSWIANNRIATANEGDLDGGSRGFSVFNTQGAVAYETGNDLDHIVARHGQYPDGRSGNKGNEPENAEFGAYDSGDFLFIASERSSMLFVYDVSTPSRPVYRQALPTALGPEGIKAIPSRNLVVAASEEDDRGDKFRGSLNIYEGGYASAQYPSIFSVDRDSGVPIPFSAQSGLAADPSDANKLYSVDDSFYGANRIFEITLDQEGRGVISDEITINDSNGVFAATPVNETPGPNAFDPGDLAVMINADGTVNLDPEGIAVASAGGFWVASEGAGTIDDASRPIEKLNFIFKVDDQGTIENVIRLPEEINGIQVRFGFEGITEYDGRAYVAIQRAWIGDDNPRIGIYDVASETWSFVFYELDAPESQNGGWVGLSDLTSLGDGSFLVLERDNQGGPDAAIKRIYRIDLSSASDGDTIARGDKQLLRDLLAEGDLTQFGNLAFEKVEGLAVMADGDVYISNDNDGVDDNSGENQLINLGNILN